MDALRLLGRLLVDDRLLVEWQATESEEGIVWTAAAAEGADRLLAARSRGARRWSPAIERAAAQALAAGIAIETVQRHELLRVTGALAAVPVPFLLIKGAAWQFTIYTTPHLRARRDVDILIDARSRAAIERALLGAGYEPAVETTTELASAQRHYSRVDKTGARHHVDLHWRVTNPLAFADVLPFRHLYDRSTRIDALDGVRTPCPVDALLLACLHRVAHHGQESGLVWLYDVHLLAGLLTDAGWGEVMRSADRSPLAGVTAMTLARARDWLGTQLPARCQAWIARHQINAADPAFLGRGVSPLELFRSDWHAVSWAGRFTLVTDHVFPSSSYMLARYGARSPAALPLLYGRRAVGGLWRWLSNGR